MSFLSGLFGCGCDSYDGDADWVKAGDRFWKTEKRNGDIARQVLYAKQRDLNSGAERVRPVGYNYYGDEYGEYFHRINRTVQLDEDGEVKEVLELNDMGSNESVWEPIPD